MSLSIWLLCESAQFRKMGKYVHFTSSNMKLNHLHKYRWKVNCRFRIYRIFYFSHCNVFITSRNPLHSVLQKAKLEVLKYANVRESLGWKKTLLFIYVFYIHTRLYKNSTIQTPSLGYWLILPGRLCVLFQHFCTVTRHIKTSCYRTLTQQN